MAQHNVFWETLGTPPNWKNRGCSLRPTFIGYACSTLAKQILDKVLCYWEHLGNLGNMLRITLGTYGNILRNMMRMALNILGNMLETHWEHGWKHETKKKKIEPCNPIPPPNSPQDKKMGPHGCMFGHLIGYMRIIFLKLFVTILGIG